MRRLRAWVRERPGDAFMAGFGLMWAAGCVLIAVMNGVG